MFHDVRAAIAREKVIKGWSRTKKVAFVEERNPAWDDKVGDLFPVFPRKTKSDSSGTNRLRNDNWWSS
jgi:hypothetical protein